MKKFNNMICGFCEKEIVISHRNKRYCSTRCINKARYKRQGMRSTKEQRSKWYKNRCSKKGYTEKLRKQSKERNQKVKKFLADYKIKLGCKDCGYKKHHSALDFDHVKDNKVFNVCFAKSITQAIKEIKKCEVVCSNCHRVRTYNRIYPCKPDIFEMTYEEV